MSRTIKDIYNEAVAERNKRLELSEFKSDSKMSVMNGILWVVAAVIYSLSSTYKCNFLGADNKQ